MEVKLPFLVLERRRRWLWCGAIGTKADADAARRHRTENFIPPIILGE